MHSDQTFLAVTRFVEKILSTYLSLNKFIKKQIQRSIILKFSYIYIIKIEYV